MREVDEEGRLRIVEMMWEMVFADGKVTEFEDNVLWRAADLLGISGRDRIDLKHRVAERQAGTAKAKPTRAEPTRPTPPPDAAGACTVRHDENLRCRAIHGISPIFKQNADIAPLLDMAICHAYGLRGTASLCSRSLAKGISSN